MAERSIDYLTENELKKLHDDLIKASGGREGELQHNLGYITEFARYKEDEGLTGIAAFYLARIAKGHPFIDCNKRTAYFATRYFLMKNGADFNGNSPEEASTEIETIAGQPNMDSAEALAKKLCSRYLIENQPGIRDYETFYRLVIKSISVANLLANR